jgi:hypothetical protein
MPVAAPPQFNPLEMLSSYGSLPVPDPITFVTGPQWLNKPGLYPRQATFLKILFLRDDLFTDYDHKVIAEWIQMFRESNPEDDENREQQFNAHTLGIQPDIYERIAWCKARGYKWFKELILAIGRRGAKGYVCALAMAYVLWNYLALGNPQDHYGIMQSKAMEVMIFAGKRDQAKAHLWRDLHDVITESECFTGSMGRNYISNDGALVLSVYAPFDEVRMRRQASKGIASGNDMATFQIMPKESNPLAARGGAGFIFGFDEAAHVKTTGMTREFREVYNAAKPALDQFGTDSFTCLPSSTWEMTGMFYELWVLSLQDDPAAPGEPMYANKLMLQLSSWHPYQDWEIAHTLDLYPPGFIGDLGEFEEQPLPRLQKLKGAIQSYDDEMRREEIANPDTFAVERRCLDPATRVLTTDLTWKPIGEVEAGDTLIGLDEYAPGPELLKGDLFLFGKRPQRKLRTTTVLKTWRTRDKAYRITFADGSSVTCSGTHRWFSGNRWRSIYAAPDAHGPHTMLKAGDGIRWIVDPWDQDESWEAGWLAGIYDGEGTFLGRGRDRQEFSLSVAQNPGQVLDNILSVLKDKGFSPVRYKRTHKPDKNGTTSICEQWYVTNLDECLRLVGQIKPLRFYSRRHQLWEGRAPHGSLERSKTKTIISIESLPKQDLVDIETTTGTFIAEGLVSHNSAWATSLDAYLNPGKVDDVFRPWEGRLPTIGPPLLHEQVQGPLSIAYVAHGDPSTVNHRFGWCVGHAEPDEQGMLHAIIDQIRFWDPSVPNPPYVVDHTIDYDEVTDWIYDNSITKFQPVDVSFDPYNVPSTVHRLNKKIRGAHLQKSIMVYQTAPTLPLNWARWECTKAAINLGLVHGYIFPDLSTELKFVQKAEGVNKVVPPESGPCVTDDIADAFSHVVFKLLGEQLSAYLGQDLRNARPGMAMSPAQTDPFRRFDPDEAGMNPFATAMAMQGHGGLARGMRPRTGTMPASFLGQRQSVVKRSRHRN